MPPADPWGGHPEGRPGPAVPASLTLTPFPRVLNSLSLRLHALGMYVDDASTVSIDDELIDLEGNRVMRGGVGERCSLTQGRYMYRSSTVARAREHG